MPGDPLFQTILVPVDLTDLEIALPALYKAAAIADYSAGSLHLLNVQTLLPSTFMDFVPPDFNVTQKQIAEQELSDVAKRLPMPDGRVTWHVRTGGVYPEILAEADAIEADLIVMGSHRPAMKTYLLGSNSKTVVRHAKCSVLVVRH
ncbi:universal stress protein [Methylovirgula sp. 4M-Z18]|uniref:universal stress protein n=1 Tax=Methylovirgula sp. 4M-Z18 TaxID=2293567 RepID=UPI000E2EFB68|nr:universal stress protein [Methylovirgula sp. 4M-Z18]RFB78908.1 universal stress protein [Methylovirgula sp. 4M-Z18]